MTNILQEEINRVVASRMRTSLRNRRRVQNDPPENNNNDNESENPKKPNYITRVWNKGAEGWRQWQYYKNKNTEMSYKMDAVKDKYKQDRKQRTRKAMRGIGKMIFAPIIAEALKEHTELMASSADGTPNMVSLVQAAMNGDPASTQSMFDSAMKEKLAVAIDTYKEISARDIFNEPSDLNADDYEDMEQELDETYGPEDEDEEEPEEYEEEPEEDEEDLMETNPPPKLHPVAQHFANVLDDKNWIRDPKRKNVPPPKLHPVAQHFANVLDDKNWLEEDEDLA